MKVRCPIRCLITGGAGFIGSHLADEAVRRGFRVKILDNLSTGRLENLADCRGDIEFIRGDVRDREAVRQAARGADFVFHHAAVADVPKTVEDPALSAEVNDLGTLNVFLAARDAGARRVVYAGSSAVYGDSTQLPHVETMTPDLGSPYAVHKLTGEYYGDLFGRLYGLEVVSLRYFNIYGARQNPVSPYSGVIAIFLSRIRRGKAPIVFGDGGQSRDFLYIKDAVDAAFLAADTPGVGGRVFNIGSGRSIKLIDLLDVLRRVTGRPVQPRFAPPRPGDPYESRADIGRAEAELGFRPAASFRDGLARTWAWFGSDDLKNEHPARLA